VVAYAATELAKNAVLPAIVREGAFAVAANVYAQLAPSIVKEFAVPVMATILAQLSLFTNNLASVMYL